MIGKIEAYQLSQNFKLKLLRARLLQKLGQDEANWLFPGARPGDPITTLPALSDTHAARDSIDDELGALTGIGQGASNEWVVAGSRTDTGKPILANDPHLDLSAPILWYLARVVTPEGSVKGATIPGAPIFVLGQNDSIAWGLTTADSNVQDLFVETVDPADRSKYLTPDGPKPFETREETIHVKGAADVKLAIRATRHGPVLSDVSEDAASVAGPGKVVALAFTGLGDHDTTAEAFMRVNSARNWDEFLDALRLYQTPTQNFVYADLGGDIGFFNPGLVPLRKSGDGLDAGRRRVGRLRLDRHDPVRSMAAAAQSGDRLRLQRQQRQFPRRSPAQLRQDWEENFRARRIQQFFDTIDKHSLDTSAAMQADHLSLDVKELQPFIATIAPPNDRARTGAGDASEVGRGDGQGPRRAVDLHRLPEIAAQDPARRQDRASDGGERPVRRDDPRFADARPSVLVRLSGRPRSGLPQGARPRARRRARLLVKRDGADMSQWRWGAEHQALLQHQVYSHVPLLDRLSDLSVSSSGGFYTLDRGGGSEAPPDLPFARTIGGGFRGLYDLADPDKSRFMIATGESGHIFSRHYGDLAPLWNDVKSITLAGSEDELRQAGGEELTLKP